MASVWPGQILVTTHTPISSSNTHTHTHHRDSVLKITTVPGPRLLPPTWWIHRPTTTRRAAAARQGGPAIHRAEHGDPQHAGAGHPHGALAQVANRRVRAGVCAGEGGGRGCPTGSAPPGEEDGKAHRGLTPRVGGPHPPEGMEAGEGVERTEAKQGVEPCERDDPITYQILTK